MIPATASRAFAESRAPAPAYDRLAGLKLALFSGNYNYLKEGANQALNKLVRHLEDQVGATVRVYSPTTRTPAFEPQGTLISVPSISLPGRSEFRLGLGLGRSVRKDIEAFGPDLIHIATPDISGNQAQTFAQAHGIPIVSSLHTRFETYCDYYGLRMLRPIVEQSLDRFYARCDLTLLPTPAMVAEFATRYGPGKTALWGRGVDSHRFDPAHRSEAWRRSHGIGQDDIALLFFGRLVLEKNVDHYAQVIQRLRSQGLPVKAVIIGDGPARRRMAALLPDALFTGHLAGDDLSVAVASCDILLNPSMTEAFGNVTLEGMAAGLAVVAARIGSATNLISDGVDGVISHHDVMQYTQAVTALITDPNRRAAIACAARETACEWRWDQILDHVLTGYESVLDRRQRLQEPRA